ncbi:hypothetical protein DL93DRAFT_290742 [Clavulina sp. PMI_390]|nr:hypothetical protein DL93DRAFT_290742 [Clavulina sp. PMI_390]
MLTSEYTLDWDMIRQRAADSRLPGRKRLMDISALETFGWGRCEWVVCTLIFYCVLSISFCAKMDGAKGTFDSVWCQACSKWLSNEKNWRAHVRTKPHITSREQMWQKQPSTPYVPPNPGQYCAACLCYFRNLRKFNQHLKESDHYDALAAFKAVAPNSLASSSQLPDSAPMEQPPADTRRESIPTEIISSPHVPEFNIDTALAEALVEITPLGWTAEQFLDVLSGPSKELGDLLVLQRPDERSSGSTVIDPELLLEDELSQQGAKLAPGTNTTQG